MDVNPVLFRFLARIGSQSEGPRSIQRTPIEGRASYSGVQVSVRAFEP